MYGFYIQLSSSAGLHFNSYGNWHIASWVDQTRCRVMDCSHISPRVAWRAPVGDGVHSAFGAARFIRVVTHGASGKSTMRSPRVVTSAK